ncbi:MAG: hypothetical protein HQK51_15345, partial [Oligoflexia bacterium]|nr:hypothetical protein [Oligoflexia bacterium]
MEIKQDRMLMMDQILHFLGVSQEKIEESVFETIFEFERKREYDALKVDVDLYSSLFVPKGSKVIMVSSPPLKKTEKEVKRIPNVSMFIQEENKPISYIKR